MAGEVNAAAAYYKRGSFLPIPIIPSLAWLAEDAGKDVIDCKSLRERQNETDVEEMFVANAAVSETLRLHVDRSWLLRERPKFGRRTYRL